MLTWKIKEKIPVPAGSDFSFHPLISMLLLQRGLSSAEQIREFLFPEYEKGIHDPFLFLDMKKAVVRIGEAKEKKEKVIIFGDYDADGITSSAILKKTLDEIGISSEIYIPDKDKEGYGMNKAAIEKFAADGAKLIITVDCGIANFEEVELANQKGVNVIITDHHHVPRNIPKAFAIINQKIKEETYPFRDLAGVGTAFKLVQALYQKFLPEKTEQLKWFLDLVAIGTIADCVPLIGENRVLAKFGLLVLSKTRNTGLREIFQVGRITIDENNVPDSTKVAFQIAPRINAAGRMEHANIALNLVMEKEPKLARGFALELEAKNQERQKVTALIFEEVRKVAEVMFKDKKFIFAVGAHFPSGILGLVAGKVADRFNKPTAIFQEKGEECKGSFRSIPEINIIEMIEKCAEFLERFGGHSQAAGVSVRKEKMNAFFEKMDFLIGEKLGDKTPIPEIEIDAEVLSKDIDFELAESVKKMEPFGEGNEKPVFVMRNLIVEDIKLVGNGEKHLKLHLRSQDGSPKIFEAIGFGLAEDNLHLDTGNKIDVVFNLGVDEWNGNKKIQLELIDLHLVNN
jgi:single-stranded-DNA-specific exonuclease